MIGLSTRAWRWQPRSLIPNEHGRKLLVLRDNLQYAFVERDPETGLHSLIGPPPASMPLPIGQIMGWSPAR